MTEIAALWTYLAREPLLWLAATLVAYIAADTLAMRLGRNPLANPILIAVILLALLLGASGTSYATYFEGAQFVHFMLGPATVALALPLHANVPRLRASFLPMCAALITGSLVAILSVLGLAWAFGVKGPVLISLAPKSATTPVALAVSEVIGGVPSLTVAGVVVTGISGAIIATPLFNALGVRDRRARGFALGLAAHGIGTAHALRIHPTAGAFSGIGMGLNALLTAILAPLVIAWFF